MGGSAGHMAHPFDCREVRNGQDLINFYVKAVNTIPLYQGEASRDEWLGDFGGVNPTSVKFDGVNASFRLEKTNTSAGFMFVHDRGAKNDKSDVGKIDYAGITSDNAPERFTSKPFETETNEEGEQVCPEGAEVVYVDGKMMCSKQHGMIHVVKVMEKILNHDLMKVKPYIEALGIFENGIGPEGVIFNAEFYSNEDPEKEIRSIKNVTDYNQNFIAIHNLQDFHTEETITKSGKITTSRKTRGYYWQAEEEINKLLDQKDQLQTQGQTTGEIDALIAEKNQDLDRRRNEHQEIINKFAGALEENANALDLPFNVHTQVGLQFKEGISRELVLKRIENALNEDLSYNYKKMTENMSVGPTKINEQTGEVEPRTLKDFLMAIKQNPAHTAYYPEEFKKTKSDGSQAPATADIKVKPEFSQRHANKAGKPLATRQSAFAKKIYDDIIVTGPETGIGVADIAADDGVSFEAINSAVILWEAVKRIGNVLKESVLSKEDFGLPMSEQEGIVIQTTKICDGIPFKFTGEFIVAGGASQFRKDAPQEMAETKIRYGELLESFMPEPMNLDEQEDGQYVILIPGGFKPPTGGHYHLIKEYDKNSNVRKVFVVTGTKEREGVTLQQSKEIFDVYGGFSDKVDFIMSDDPTPLTTCYELVKNENFVNQFPNLYFSIGASDKGGDPARIKQFVDYFNKSPNLTTAEVREHPPAAALSVDGQPASASRLRKAFVEEDWETFKKLLPHESFYDDVVQILTSRGGENVNENFLLAVPQSFLVEGQKEPNPWAICTAQVGRDDESKYENCVKSVKKQYNINEELLSEEDQLKKLKERIRMLVNNLGGNVDKILNTALSTTSEKIKDIFEPLADSIASQLMGSLAVETSPEVEQEVEEFTEELVEMSSAAGGAVQGYAGNAFIGEEDDE